MLRVAPRCVLEQVAAALFRDSGGLCGDEAAYSVWIAEVDSGLQLLLRQQASPWLKQYVLGIIHEHPVVCWGQPSYGCVTLK